MHHNGEKNAYKMFSQNSLQKKATLAIQRYKGVNLTFKGKIINVQTFGAYPATQKKHSNK